LLKFALEYFFGLHIKRLINLNFLVQYFGTGVGICLHCPAGYMPATLSIYATLT